jgi:hypothetical protein
MKWSKSRLFDLKREGGKPPSLNPIPTESTMKRSLTIHFAIVANATPAAFTYHQMLKDNFDAIAAGLISLLVEFK